MRSDMRYAICLIHCASSDACIYRHAQTVADVPHAALAASFNSQSGALSSLALLVPAVPDELDDEEPLACSSSESRSFLCCLARRVPAMRAPITAASRRRDWRRTIGDPFGCILTSWRWCEGRVCSGGGGKGLPNTAAPSGGGLAGTGSREDGGHGVMSRPTEPGMHLDASCVAPAPQSIKSSSYISSDSKMEGHPSAPLQ